MCFDYMCNHTHMAVSHNVVTRKNYIKYKLSLYRMSSNYSYSKGREVMNLINFFFFTENLKNLKKLIFTKGSERMWLPWQLGYFLIFQGSPISSIPASELIHPVLMRWAGPFGPFCCKYLLPFLFFIFFFY